MVGIPICANAQTYFNKNFHDTDLNANNLIADIILNNDTIVAFTMERKLGSKMVIGVVNFNLYAEIQKNKKYNFDTIDSYWSDGNSNLIVENNIYSCINLQKPSQIFKSYLAKFELNGDTVWIRDINNPSFERNQISKSLKTSNNKIVISSVPSKFDSTINLYTSQIGLTCYDTDAIVNWHHEYGYPQISEEIKVMRETFDNGYYLGGKLYPLQSNSNFYLIKTDSLGNMLWQRTWGSIYNDCISDILEMPNGNLLVCGLKSEETNGFDFRRAYLAMLSSDGSQVLWQRTFFGLDVFNAFDTEFSKIFKNSDGTFHIWGNEVNYQADITRPLLMSFSSNFDSLDVKYYSYWNGSGAQNYLRDVVRMPDNGYMACGFGWDDNSNEDGWLLRVDSNGCANVNCTPLNISKSNASTFQIYPNPANDKLQVSSDETIKQCLFYDISGKVIMTIDSFQGSRNIDVSNLSDGLYLLKIQFANGEERSKKISIVH
jgi:hypothetical protein